MSPRTARSLAALAATTLALGALAACDSADGANTPTPTAAATSPATNTAPATPSTSPSSPPATSSTPTPSQTPSSSPTSQADKDKQGASKVVIVFHSMLDKLSSNPKSNLTELDTVARDSSYLTWGRQIRVNREKHIRQTGKSVVRIDKVVRSKKQWVVTACVNVSKVNGVDKKGHSVVKPNRPDTYIWKHWVIKDKGKFYVVEDKSVGFGC